ncbi:MAG: hypothetical protein KatS3mg022_2837 [Armatimonadota bacterium]|nr:MAG: hypothetical protein KatS3mg022_2837 [Armatimonadota bacterium]
MVGNHYRRGQGRNLLSLAITVYFTCLIVATSQATGGFPPELIWFRPVLEPKSLAYSSSQGVLAVPASQGTISLYRVQDRVLMSVIPAHDNRVNAVAFSPDGNLLASGSDDKTVKVWQISQSGRAYSLRYTLQGHTSWINAVAFSPDGSLLASASRDGTIRLWDTRDGTLVRTITGHSGSVTCIAFSPDGQLIASGSEDRTVGIWQTSDGSAVRTLEGHDHAVRAVAFSPDGSRVASGSDDRTVCIWDANSGTLISTLSGLSGHSAPVTSVTFVTDGLGESYVVSGSEDTVLKVWRVSDGSLQRTMSGHILAVRSVLLLPNGQQIASGSDDATVRIWPWSDGAQLSLLAEHTDDITAVAVYPDDSRIASAGKDGRVILRNLSSGEESASINAHSNWIYSVAFSSNGQWLATGSRDNTARLWNATTGGSLVALAHPSWVYHVSFSPDNTLLATTCEDRHIRLWNTSTGGLVRDIDANVYVYAAAFSPDNTLIAAALDNGTVGVYRVSDGQLVNTLNAHTGRAYAVAFSPMHNLFASAGQDGQVKIWRTTDWSLLGTLSGHEGPVYSIAFSVDGSFLVSGGEDNTVRYWSVPDLVPIKVLRGHTRAVRSVALSRDGVYAASAGDDAVALWRVREAPYNVPPFVPQVFSPTDRAIVPPAPTFELRAEDANNDRVRFVIELVQGENTITQQTEFVDSGKRLTYTLPTELASGEWTWRVKAQDAKGSEGEWSAPRTFTANRAPQVAEVLEPEDGVVVSPTPTFRLRASDAEGDQVKFVLRFTQGETQQTVETPFGESGRSLTFTLPQAQALASGQWQYEVKAVDAKGSEGEWSAPRTFTANRAPLTPEVIEPADGAVVAPAPTFVLRASDDEGDQVRFLIELVQGENTITQQTEFVDSGKRLTYTLPTELASGEWTWRVKAQDAKGSEGEWSAPRTFTANRAPQVAEVLEPEDGVVVSPTPTFRLRASDAEGDQVKFVLRFTQGETQQTVETPFGESGRSLTFTLPQAQALASGQWQYEVKAVDAKGSEGEWSAPRTFTANRAPLTPEVIEPADGAVVAPAPTFVLRASDDEGDQVRFLMELVQGENTITQQTEFVDSGKRLTYTLPTELASGEWMWRVKAQDAKGSEGAAAEGRFTVSDKVLVEVPAALSAWGLSLQVGNKTKADLGLADVPMRVWDPTTWQYREVAPDEVLVPGTGYWMKPGAAARLIISGAPVTSPVTIHLKAGWNHISSPLLMPVTWSSDAIRVRRNSEELTLTQARQVGWIAGYAWGWNAEQARYQLVHEPNIVPGAQTQLAPWQGYWIYAHQECDLVIAPSRREQAHNRLVTEQTPGPWSIRLQVQLGTHLSGVFIGGSRSAQDITVGLPPDPPSSSPIPKMYLARQGTQLAADLRAEGRANTPWEVVVQVPAGSTDSAVLLWQGTHTTPRGVNPVLVDLQTGERKFLRTTSSHTFAVSRQGGEYRFRIEMLPANQLLKIMHARVSGGRSTGGRYTISYQLSDVAQVDVSIMANGKMVRRLVSGITRSAGVQQITWDGRDSNGIALPAGAYVAEIRASSSDGQVVRTMLPIVLTR